MSFIVRKFLLLVFIFPLLFAGCASTTSSEYARAVNDPLEPMNRVTFSFNRVVDTLVLKPLAMAYETVVPEIMQDCVENFLENLFTPVTIVNNALQGDFEKAGVSLGRFMTNTVYGLGGVMDVATMVDIPKNTTNFSATLAKWGIDEGPYLVLPVVGPSSFRAALGMGVDFFMNPVNIVVMNPHNEKWANLDLIRFGVEGVVVRAKALPITDDLERNSIDLYAATRSMYQQNRAFATQKMRNVEKLDYDYDFESYDE